MFGFGKSKKLQAQVETLQNEIAEIKAQDISITDSQAFSELFLGGGFGKRVINEKTAMQQSAVFACVSLIAGAVSTASIEVHQRTEGNKRKFVEKHPVKKLLTSNPSTAYTPASFWKRMVASKVLHGNAYAFIDRERSGRIKDLLPLLPSRCQAFQAWEIGMDSKLSVSPYRLYYQITFPNGKSALIDQDDMLHIPNLNFDGKKGLSSIEAGAQTIGLGLTAEDSATELFDNGLLSEVAIKYEGKVSPEAAELIRKHVADRHVGRGKRHKPLVLSEGGEATPMSINAKDAQLLEARQFSVIDICRFFSVPPVMIGESEKNSSFGSGVEQMASWFNKFTLNNHLTDIEQEIEKKIFRHSGFFAEFNTKPLTRGDMKTRAEYYKAAIGGTQNPAWMAADEIREEEGLPPSDGKDLFVPKVKGGGSAQE